jgi:predicted ATPase/DNA-binding SARP family transcriptional activator
VETAETLRPDLREAIRDGFGVPIVDAFGSTEGLVGTSLPDDPVLAFNDDVCIIELVDAEDRPVPDGVPSAKVLITNLSNHLQPLIRYELADRFVRQPAAAEDGHLRATVEGRSDDVLRYERATIHPHVIGAVLAKTTEVIDYQVRQTRGYFGYNRLMLTLRLFGRFEATPALDRVSRKAQWLIALLSLHPERALERSFVAGTLWPDTSEAQARYNLRRELVQLRRALGDEAHRLRADGHTLALDLDGADVDVLAFDAAVRAGDATALALHRGPLLADCDEPWVVEHREARRRAVLSCAEAAAASAPPAEAAALLRRAVALDPLDERLRRALMRALADAGSPGSAVATYRDLRLELDRDLQAEPAPETRALRDAIQRSASGASPRPPRRRLPSPLTRLVGREADVATVLERLTRDRLLTLTGAGGVGKSRLAVEVAHAFTGDVAFAELGRLADAALVPAAIARALDVTQVGGRRLDELLAAAVSDRALLLVLDDCEHLVGAVAPLVAALVAAGPRLTVLATSRRSLGLPGEAVWRVPSLGVDDAAALFEERAAQAGAGSSDRAAVAEICLRLDGIPQAIELAAARARALTAEQILARLDDRFRLLAAGRAALPRHRTVEAALAFSHELLDDEERQLLAELSVFAGRFSLEDAEAIHGGDVLEALDGLVDKSVVAFDGRFRLLETVRAFARRDLPDAARARHLAHHVALAEEAEPHLFGGSGVDAWVARLEAVFDDLRAAMDWAYADPARADDGLRIYAALSWLWFDRGLLAEARAVTAAAARQLPHASPPRAARVLAAAAWVEVWDRNHARALGLFAESLDVARPLGDAGLIAYALGGVAIARLVAGDAAAARVAAEEAERQARTLPQPALLVFILQLSGGVSLALGELDGARALLDEALVTARACGYRAAIGHVLIGLGHVARARGDRRGAWSSWLEGARAFRPREHCGRSRVLEALGHLALDDGQPILAARLLGAAEVLHEQIGLSVFIPRRPDYAGALAAARRAVEEAEFARAWADGRRTGADGLVAELGALGAAPRLRLAKAAPSSPGS